MQKKQEQKCTAALAQHAWPNKHISENNNRPQGVAKQEHGISLIADLQTRNTCPVRLSTMQHASQHMDAKANPGDPLLGCDNLLPTSSYHRTQIPGIPDDTP